VVTSAVVEAGFGVELVSPVAISSVIVTLAEIVVTAPVVVSVFSVDVSPLVVEAVTIPEVPIASCRYICCSDGIICCFSRICRNCNRIS